MANTPQTIENASAQFWAAHEDALFPQFTLTAITGLSGAYFERARWAGFGPKFIKLGRLVRYRKSHVLAWLNQHPTVASTTEAGRSKPQAPGTIKKVRVPAIKTPTLKPRRSVAKPRAAVAG